MPDFSRLTEKQKKIYEFIREQIEVRGYPPTIRDIGKAFHISSPNGVMCHLKALQSKGLIKRKEQSARAIELIDYKPGQPAVLPFYGYVAAGSPTAIADEAQTNEQLNLMDLLGGNEHYVLKVRGQSMIESHIDDGDYVVIRKKGDAENGERVVARIDNEVTLKRFYKRKDHIRLEPDNGTMAPIIVEPGSNIEIMGTLVGVVRRC
jgi:repressor LexA